VPFFYACLTRYSTVRIEERGCRSRSVWCSCGRVEAVGSLSPRASSWCPTRSLGSGPRERREEQGRADGSMYVKRVLLRSIFSTLHTCILCISFCIFTLYVACGMGPDNWNLICPPPSSSPLTKGVTIVNCHDEESLFFQPGVVNYISNSVRICNQYCSEGQGAFTSADAAQPSHSSASL